jgi:co-chaperonin GroES (HSP10)
MKFRPLEDRVLVQRIELKEQKHGTIIVPDSAKEKPMEGKVVAVGAGKRDRSTSKWGIGCCSGSTRAPRSRSTTTTGSS